MSLTISNPAPVESQDLIELDVNTFLISPIIQDDLDAANPPATINNQAFNASTGQLQSVSYAAALNGWAPVLTKTEYSPRNILGRMNRPKIATADLFESWAAYSGVNSKIWSDPTKAPDLNNYGARLKLLETQASQPALNWMKDRLTNSDVPLPALTAEATMDSLANSTNSIYAQTVWRGDGNPDLNREFYPAST